MGNRTVVHFPLHQHLVNVETVQPYAVLYDRSTTL